MLSAFAVDTSSCKEALDIVIGATHSKEGEGELKTHIAGLESLRADHN